MAFYTPDQPEFCVKANEKVCGYLDTINCCCTEELKALASCKFTNELGPKLGVVGCEYKCGGGDGEDGEGGVGGSSSMMMMIIIGAGAFVILACAGFFIRRRRQLRQAASDKDSKDSKVSQMNVKCCLSLILWICNLTQRTPFSLLFRIRTLGESTTSSHTDLTPGLIKGRNLRRINARARAVLTLTLMRVHVEAIARRANEDLTRKVTKILGGDETRTRVRRRSVVDLREEDLTPNQIVTTNLARRGRMAGK